MAQENCSEWARTITQIAMNIASRQGVGTDLDSVVKEMQERGMDIDRDTVADAIVEATEREGRSDDRIADAVNAVKQEARTDRALFNRIAALERTLAAGEVPVTLSRAKKQATAAIAQARGIRDSLKKQLARSEPVRKAAIQKQIAAMDAIIEEGNFAPRVKPDATPMSKELDRLTFERDEKRRSINRQINKLKPQSVWIGILDKLNITRAIMTSFDLSAVFRQGGFFVFSNPLLAAKSMVPMFRAVLSAQAADKVNREIAESSNSIWYSRTKLAVETDPTLTQREEAYQTTWLETLDKVPVLRQFIRPIRASERAYTTFLHKLRADAFDTFAATLTKDGDLNLEQAQAITNFVNVATGRGTIAGFEKSALTMNALFFSPRLLSSRFQMIGGLAAPGAVFKAPAEVRGIIRRQYARYLIGIGLMYFMASLAFGDDDEFDIEFDPRSSDFGKLRFGNTRIDPLSGMSQTIVLLARTFPIGGGFKSASTQNLRKLRGTDLPFGQKDAFEVGVDFFRNKFSPIFGTFVDVYLKGQTFEGGPITPTHIAGRFLPMTFEEIRDSIQDQGLTRGSAISLMAVFGMGVQVWGQAFERKTRQQLRDELKKNTYQKTQTVTRSGEKVRVRRGQPHIGEEGRVKAIREELRKRAS